MSSGSPTPRECSQPSVDCACAAFPAQVAIAEVVRRQQHSSRPMRPGLGFRDDTLEKQRFFVENAGATWHYTGSACIPMALDDAIELSKIKRGDLVVMISSGLGWNQAAAAIRMTM
jgi:hypothetical protein